MSSVQTVSICVVKTLLYSALLGSNQLHSSDLFVCSHKHTKVLLIHFAAFWCLFLLSNSSLLNFHTGKISNLFSSTILVRSLLSKCFASSGVKSLKTNICVNNNLQWRFCKSFWEFYRLYKPLWNKRVCVHWEILLYSSVFLLQLFYLSIFKLEWSQSWFWTKEPQ